MGGESYYFLQLSPMVLTIDDSNHTYTSACIVEFLAFFVSEVGTPCFHFATLWLACFLCVT